MNSEPKMIECKPISDKMKHLGPTVYLEEKKARELASQGIVEIKGEEAPEQNTPKPIQVDISYLKRDQFSSYKHLTKVAWVQDMSKLGGAELSNCMVVKAGEIVGFDIVGITPAKFKEKILDECDVVILNNCMEFTSDQFHRLRYHLHERSIPFVKYEHDYREFRRQNVSSPFFLRSILNVFISPEHKKRYVKTFGNRIEKHSITLPLAIDTKLFSVNGIDKEHNSILVPNYKKCGDRIDEYMKKNPKKKYAVIGQVQNPLPVKVEHLPRVENEHMPSYYGRYEHMLHLPKDYWAGERIYFEAALCKCKPIIDKEKVGHASWGFDITDTVFLRQKLDRAPFLFWKAVERCLLNAQ
jgi:hypothetical protein